eukprot:gene3358-8272_t
MCMCMCSCVHTCPYNCACGHTHHVRPPTQLPRTRCSPHMLHIAHCPVGQPPAASKPSPCLYSVCVCCSAERAQCTWLLCVRVVCAARVLPCLSACAVQKVMCAAHESCSGLSCVFRTLLSGKVPNDEAVR